MKHGSLFSGIGGFDLAAEWMGWENVFHCEWNPFGQRILKHYWPNAKSYDDITKTDFTSHRGAIDILTGGFPCQPYSLAGKRKGKADDRHLWPEMLRAIREIQPQWVVGENVFGIVNWNGGMVFDEVQADLEAEGYEVQPYVLPACAVNAPHRRDRVWFIANSISKRTGNKNGKTDNKEWSSGKDWSTGIRQAHRPIGTGGIDTANANGITAHATGKRKRPGDKEQREDERSREQLVRTEQGSNSNDNGEGRIITDTNAAGQWWNEWEGKGKGNLWEQFPTQSPLCGGDDGLPYELDGITFSKWRNESLKAYGNAIVPQVALQIFKAIEAYSSFK
jgi:DNA (cytosine-5)-methyltransferase 1